jgi:hypothetical protein
MYMKKIGVDLSPHQRRRLHNGHKVRVKKGEGIMMVSPGNFDTMSRTFLRGKAKEIQLSQEEILANRPTSPEAHNVTRGEVSKPPSVAPQVAPIKSNISGGRISNAGGPRGIRVHTMNGLKKVSDHLQRLEDVTGLDVGDQLKSGLANLLADAQTARMNELSVLKRTNIIGGGKFGEAKRSIQSGRGVGQVGVSGNLLANHRELPQALQSQPFSANWGFANQLPPQYHQFNRS